MTKSQAARVSGDSGSSAPEPPGQPPFDPLLDDPILMRLLKLATPNTLALCAGMSVVIAETSYVGRLGTEPLAAMALVFPFIMLTMTMSGGAMGGGVRSAIARALGARDDARASALALHALMIATCFGLTFMLVMLLFGRDLLTLLGGRGRVLNDAMSYIQIFFGGAVIPWFMQTFASILRGTGNMKLPSALVFSSAAIQITLGGALALGLGPFPQLGLPGVAAGTLTAFSFSILVMGWFLASGNSRVLLTLRGFRFRKEMFFDILKVGAVSVFSPLQSVLTVTILTSMLARFGTEVLAGYGIGTRLEFMLTSIAFAIGISATPMVGMAIGANRIGRARQVAWTAAAVAFTALGLIGTLLSIFPDLWVSMFTADASVRDASRRYLHISSPMLAFMGLNSALYFSSQGAAKIIGPVLSQTGRLIFVVIGGAWLTSINASDTSFFMLAAASMTMLGLTTALVVWRTSWGPRTAKL
ncbi:MATE family efflux transporter [Bradyrhizobium sp. LHD-71]|uniref:MATE family efflux transporter n=1 Tax=Bradyrhizobium sp. LHD-71 TaxID=3072141 RepID=UPI0028105C63|nr:MATE family efflux transporter [Bradyrhizobium sp. LHD-71]MDQ8728946.1 MATE family efflux transporter [Bradyrhizobium sp. LHD-71]